MKYSHYAYLDNWKPCVLCFRWFNRAGDDTCSEICWDQWMERWVYNKEADKAAYDARDKIIEDKLPGQIDLF